MENKNAKNVILAVMLILLVICMVFVVVKVIDIYAPSNNNIGNEQVSNNDVGEKEDTVGGKEQDDTATNNCEPFICFDDVSHIESKDLIAKANKIDERLRRVLALISLNNGKEGLLTLNDVDKFKLHSLVINNFIEEDKYLLLENSLDQSIVSASEYEKVFTEITGIEDVKEFFKGYELKTVKDANQSVYYKENGKTYYIVPFGIGMETGLSVISDVNEKTEKTELVVKTYDADYENDKYTHIKTTTFEIEKDGLRVYSINVEKAK